jgi:Tol biopolymer transport system component/DNA-binding winged helix-turn-helix (wHTH) protein
MNHDAESTPQVSVLQEAETDPGGDRSRDYKQQLRIGDFQVDPGALMVQSVDGAVRLKPKAMAVLLELARQPGITVSRDELLDRVWENTYITPGVVGHAITALRRAFGDPLEQPAYIETIPRIGYRLIAPVEWIGAGLAPEGHIDPSASTPPGHAPVTASGSQQAGVAAARKYHRSAAWIAASAVAIVAIAIAAWWWWTRPLPGNQALKVADIRRLTFATGSENNPRLNSGGDWLVYALTARLGAKPELFLQSSYGTEAIALAQGDHAERPTWSPQGRRVAYAWREGARCELRIASIDDKSRQTVAPCPGDSLVYLDWNPADERVIAYTALQPGQAGGARLQLLRDQGGWHPIALDYERNAGTIDLFPRFSPDGRRIAFRRGSNPTSDIYLISAAGGPIVRVTTVRASIAGFDWLPDGSGLVFASDHEGRQELYTVNLADHAVASLGLVDASSPDIAAREWRMTYQMEDWRSALTEIPLQAGAQPRLLAPSSGRDQAATLSPDGRRAVFVSDRDGSSQLWSLDRASGKTERLTEHAGVRVDLPMISPDGQRILYVTRARGRHELWEYRFRGETRRRISAIPAALRNAVYASDGRSLWYVAWQGTRWTLFRCERRSADITCEGSPTTLPALRVERTRLDGVDVLVLASSLPSGGLEIVAENDLRPLHKVGMPPSDKWIVVDDAVWSLRDVDSTDADGITLYSTSLRDGKTRSLATFPGLRPLGLSSFQATPDRKALVLPTLTANSTDVGFARLVPATR